MLFISLLFVLSISNQLSLRNPFLLLSGLMDCYDKGLWVLERSAAAGGDWLLISTFRLTQLRYSAGTIPVGSNWTGRTNNCGGTYRNASRDRKQKLGLNNQQGLKLDVVCLSVCFGMILWLMVLRSNFPHMSWLGTVLCCGKCVNNGVCLHWCSTSLPGADADEVF